MTATEPPTPPVDRSDAGQPVPATRPPSPPSVRRTRRRRRPSGAATAAAAQHRPDRQGLDRRAGRARRLAGRRALSRRGARRVTDQVDAFVLAGDRRAADRLADDVARGVDRVGDGLDDVRRRDGAARGHGRLPALAPPVHVPRQRRSCCRSSGVLLIAAFRPAPAVRRDDHRAVAGLLAAVGDRRGRLVHRRRHRSTCSSCPAGRGASPRSSAPSSSASSSPLALYLGVDHPFDVLVGVALGVAIPLIAFRFFTPNEVVPGHLPRRQDRPPRRRRPARRGAATRRRGPARRHRRRRAAGRPRRVRRLDAAAPAPRRRSRTRTCSGSSTR